MKNIKILIVVDQLEVGGAGRVCSILANGLAERNYQVCVCTAVKYHSIQYPLLENVEIKEWYEYLRNKSSISEQFDLYASKEKALARFLLCTFV